ncbi:hypothetical protein JNUCC64_17140 [Streptomyces sp. JNUCC 64]
MRGTLAAGAALCVVSTGAVSTTALSLAVAPTALAAEGRPEPYAFVAGAPEVEGARGTAGAPRLVPGKTYRSVLPHEGKLYYRMELGTSESAYVSATAVPETGAELSFKDGYSLAVQDANGVSCLSDRARFGASESPRPLTAWAARRTGGRTFGCRAAGPYYVVIEREGDTASSREPWDLELRFSLEPPVRGAVPSTAPTTWDSASPTPVTGTPRTREGGHGFGTATRLDQGVWQDRLRAGETRYYWVPVDWGQQLSARVELDSVTDGAAAPDGPNAPGGGRGLGRYVPAGLVASLFNPARGPVEQVQSTYDGKQKAVSFGPLPPVRYENRFAVSDEVNGMRFGGRYYLAVHLSEAVAEQFGDGPIGVRLKVGVKGEAGPPPAYDGRPLPAVEFGAAALEGEPGPDRDAAGGGAAFARGPVMKKVAAGAFATGTALVLFLVLWTVVARRRAARARRRGNAEPVPAGVPALPGPVGPPESGGTAGTDTGAGFRPGPGGW